MIEIENEKSSMVLVLQRFDVLEALLQELRAEVKTHAEAIATLTESLTAELDHELGTPPGNFLHRDRRGSSRRGASRILVTLTIAHQSPNELLQGWVINYSFGGLALLTEHVVPVSSFLKLKPPSANSRHVEIEVQVRSRVQEGKYWRLGCQLLWPLESPELEQFLGLESVSEDPLSDNAGQ
ncbi:hypothetical protein AYO44_16905 [Planctomycetaceae bacterium SCGC AG-212-F19]|nr:hypothetical protein AYO44_16905 [Planctomycetaceae bacterium SCGC AG-212-F19]